MVAIGSDHGGYELKEKVKKYLKEKHIEYKDVGTYSEESVDYPDIAEKVSKEIQTKQCEKGILICRSGIGMAIVANKFKGIRCVECDNEEKAKFSKMHNDCNIIALGADYIKESQAVCIIRAWNAAEFERGRHAQRLAIIEEIEAKNMK